MLKYFDFFRKIRTDQELTSTTGGCFTVLAIVVAAALIFMSINDFYEEKYHTFLELGRDDSEFLPMIVDIEFMKLPCQALGIDFMDELKYTEHNLEQKLKRHHKSKSEGEETLYEKKENREEEKKALREHLKNGFGCRVTGTLPLPKTPGTLVFNAKRNNNILLEADHTLALNVRMNYRISDLQFGLRNSTFNFPVAHKSKNIERYIQQLEGNFKIQEFVQDHSNTTAKVNFFSHLKIIPVVIHSAKNQTKDIEGYRYSLRSGWAPDHELTQTVKFLTEIEPINIVYSERTTSLYDLFRQLLAIVGGTVASIGLINSVSHFFFRIQ